MLMPQNQLGRLGSFESLRGWSFFGDFAGAECAEWTKKCNENDAKDPDPKNRAACWKTKEYVCQKEGGSGGSLQSSASSSASSGVSAGEVLTGIGAILKPLAEVGVGIYAASQQAKLAKMQMKHSQQQASAAPMPMYIPPPPQKKSPILFIVIGLVVLMMMGGMFYMMQGGGAASGGYAAPTGGSPGIAPVAAPRITKVKRVRKRRRHPR